LTQWAANSAVEYLRSKLEPGESYDEIQLAQWLDEARFNFRRISNRAKGIGSLAHEWIHDYLRWRFTGEGAPPRLPVNEQARRACQAALEWVENHHVEPREMESRIYSRCYGYAGTLDQVARVNGRLAILDWKTSGGIYPEYRLQLAAYKQAYEEMHDDVPGLHRWIVRLGKDDGALEAQQLPHKSQTDELAAFLGAMRIWGFLNGEIPQ